jgi:hypothetical protein
MSDVTLQHVAEVSLAHSVKVTDTEFEFESPGEYPEGRIAAFVTEVGQFSD